MSDFKLRISAKGLFFNSKGEVLLVKGNSEFHDKEFWSVPGGGVEENEFIKDAVCRELTEETGYFGQVHGIVFVQDLEFRKGRRQLELFFRGEINESREPLPDNNDHEFAFFSPKTFKDIYFLPESLDPFNLTHEISFQSNLNS